MGTHEEEVWQPAKTRWSEKTYLIYNQTHAAKMCCSVQAFYLIISLNKYFSDACVYT